MILIFRRDRCDLVAASIGAAELCSGSDPNVFPDGYERRGKDVEIAFRSMLERTEICIDAIAVRGYHGAEVF